MSSPLVERGTVEPAAQTEAFTPMTFVGVQVMAGMALLLGNDTSGSTLAVIAYDDERPVEIREAS
jgi:hypothetical protein